MTEKNQFALKEWAVIVNGLKTGKQIILLRKGGVEDAEGEFRLQHSEFFLYPTFEHQRRKLLRPEFLGEFDRALAEKPAGEEVSLSTYAEVAECLLSSDLDKLRRLFPYHLWNDAYIKLRFNYKPERPLYVLVLRAYEVPSIRIPERIEYRGCKSWVDLGEEIPTQGARPILTDAEFEAQRNDIRRRLQ